MTRSKNFQKKAKKIKHGYCISMLNSAWFDLIDKGNKLKLHDKCPNSEWNRQKQLTFNRRHFQMEGARFKNEMFKIFGGIRTAWIEYLKPAVIKLAPIKVMPMRARIKKPQVAQATTKVFKSISGDKILSLTDMHTGVGPILLVMQIISNKVSKSNEWINWRFKEMF